MIPGGWQIHETITKEYLEMFENFRGNLTNGEYTPLAVGTMLLGSTTVCFICRTLLPNGKEYFSKVIIQTPIGSEPKFVSAKEIFIG